MNKVEILVGDKSNVDFSNPIEMNKEQKEEFLELLDSMFSVVEINHVNSSRDQRMGDKLFQREWTLEEYALLLKTENTSNITKRLGRTWMSVDIQRGSFLPDYMAWAEEKGIDLVRENKRELIEKYLEDKELVKKVRRKKRKKLKKLKKELEDMKKREEKMDIDFLKAEEVVTEGEIKKFEEKKQKIKKEIKYCKEVLNNVEKPGDIEKIDEYEAKA